MRFTYGEHDVGAVGTAPGRAARMSLGGNLLRLGLVALAAVSLALTFASPAWAATLTVNDDTTGPGPAGVDCAAADHDTIQEAIDDAADGDTILVCAGTYNERPNVTKSLTINGAQAGNDAREDRTTVGDESVVQSGDSNNNIFNIAADNVTLDGFTIQGTDTADNIVGVGAAGTISGYEILNNIVEDTSFGIYANGSDATIENNLIQNNNRAGASSGNGIYADQGSTNITVNENEFAEHENTSILFTAVPPSRNSDLFITNNDITGNRIFLSYTDDSTVSGNTITDSLFSGVQIAGGNDNINVKANTITGSGQTTEDDFLFPAVRVTDSVGGGGNAGTVVFGNTLTDNDAGVSVRDSDVVSDTVEIHKNRIFGNVKGVDNGDAGDDDAQVNADNNWWGCNEGPDKDGCDTTEGDVDADEWLVLTVRANPSTVQVNQPSNITADFTINSDGDDVGPGFPDGTTVEFDTNLGTVTPPEDETEDGLATTVFRSQSAGTATVSASLDAETASTRVTVQGPDNCTISGNGGNNTLTGTSGRDIICGFGGNDTLRGLSGMDELRGGNGADILEGGNGNDTLRGDSGTDTLRGGNDNDDVTGQGGADRLFSGAGDDDLFGQSGNDSLNTRDGDSNDLANGGANTDTCQTDQGDTRVSCEN